MAEIAAVVLAAGRSSRFREGGGREDTKLVATLGGKPLIRRVAEAALASRAAPVVVVTGHARESVEAALSGLSVRFAYNADFASGIASSLRTGLDAAPHECNGAVVLLGDMPAVTAALIDALIEQYESRPAALAVAPHQNGQRGNPVLLSQTLFAAARRLEGDVGARTLLDALSSQDVAGLPLPGQAASLDVDTVADLMMVQGFE